MHKPNSTRLYFLDWVRVLAFFLLIFYHVGMYYVTWDWHVKSPYASDTIEPLMMLSSPWRLGLLFMISGVASRFMLDKLKAGAFLRQRSVRLLVPLVFGMFAVVPLQPYFEVVEKLGYDGGFLHFMNLYVHAYHGFCKDGSCLTLPTWNHLWFVAYLWVYTVALALIMLAAGSRIERWSGKLAGLLSGWRAIAIPAAVLAAARVALLSRFPQTHALVDDVYNHAQYFFLFLLGVLVAREHGFWRQLDALRWPALGMALACWATLMLWFGLPEGVLSPQMADTMRPVMRSVYALCSWAPIVAVCGFGHRHLNVDSPRLRYLTLAVFPVYILHQTIIVSLAHLIKPSNRPPVLEGFILIGLTFVLCFAGYELIRRAPLLRPLFGLAMRDARSANPQSSAVSAPSAA